MTAVVLGPLRVRAGGRVQGQCLVPQDLVVVPPVLDQDPRRVSAGEAVAGVEPFQRRQVPGRLLAREACQRPGA